MAAVNNFTHDTFTFADDGESMAKLLLALNYLVKTFCNPFVANF